MTAAKKPIPGYVAEQIAITTGADPKRGVTRAAHAATCHRCGYPTIRGLDSDIAAIDIHVDPTALTILGEAVAWTNGIATFDRHYAGLKLVLNRREDRDFISFPAGATKRHDVHPQHHCDRRWRLPPTKAPTAFPPPRAIQSSAPPF